MCVEIFFEFHLLVKDMSKIYARPILGVYWYAIFGLPLSIQPRLRLLSTQETHGGWVHILQAEDGLFQSQILHHIVMLFDNVWSQIMTQQHFQFLRLALAQPVLW